MFFDHLICFLSSQLQIKARTCGFISHPILHDLPYAVLQSMVMIPSCFLRNFQTRLCHTKNLDSFANDICFSVHGVLKIRSCEHLWPPFCHYFLMTASARNTVVPFMEGIASINRT
jgi:hypothetical protein